MITCLSEAANCASSWVRAAKTQPDSGVVARLNEGLEALQEGDRRVERIVGAGIRLGGEALEERQVVPSIALDQSGGEVRLAVKMMKERALGDFGRLQDLVERRPGKALAEH